VFAECGEDLGVDQAGPTQEHHLGSTLLEEKGGLFATQCVRVNEGFDLLRRWKGSAFNGQVTDAELERSPVSAQ
jgi:hypothetical protein